MECQPPVACLRCGRPLRATASRASGMGPVCRAKVRAAEKAAHLERFTPAQVMRAEELIELGGLVPSGSPEVVLAVSTSGAATYAVRADIQTCTCPAGQHGNRCYHLAAAEIWRQALPHRKAAA